MKFETNIQNHTNPLPGSIPKTIYYKLSVKLKNEGLTILELYSNSFPKVDKQVWIDKIENGLLTVNGQKCKTNLVIKAGWLTENIAQNKTEPSVSNQLKLIYEDDNIIVLNKPSPLPMHPSGRFNRNTLTNFLKLAFPNQTLKIVHRLDANTTGAIILAKDSETAAELGTQFQNNTVKKEYLALVEGIIEKDTFVVREKISKTKTASGGREVNDSGLDSETKLTVLDRNTENNTTLLKVEPKNGRTNQIRLHLASINHPIVGDLGYKNSDYFENNPLTYPKDSLFLHAHKIKVFVNNTETQFIAEIPKKFLKQL
jgi:RluA family pseudouridine synthase